ncbi:hypothetical protein [Winogradskyella vidalii]|uniref:hypothetical protein n=1 Tax=Winogradskyella vidalii TaxID=2615024 RepID=UPI0015C777A0|nr:hypothetical protein [Winogradskyella vidalii]
MKKLFFTLLFFGFCFFASADNQPKVGDQLVIKEPTAQTYNHIEFPKPNILIKRGTVDRYKSVYGNNVLVDEVVTKKDGETHVVLKKKDGTKFFGYLNKVKANYNKSIEDGELAVIK